MVESQDADAGSVVEDHDENSLPLDAEKIGKKRPRKTKEQASAERADQLAVLENGYNWMVRKVACLAHTGGGSGGVGGFVGGGADSIFTEGDTLDSETARDGLLRT